DYQIKLRGQRIETGEIEKLLLQSSKDIKSCVVLKTHDEKLKQDHLIAYVELLSKTKADESSLLSQINEYCQSHLPLYMIPSMFIILDQLPLNSNGKIDRKQLPKPDFSKHQIYSNNTTENLEYIEPKTDLENELHLLWSKLFSLEKLSMNQNFFSLGGNSLLLMKLFTYYQGNFSLKQDMNIIVFFKHPTIIDHVRLIMSQMNVDDQSSKLKKWHPHHVTE
ncbi:unnamed protein product, partial [Didymodactylos carnosus]